MDEENNIKEHKVTTVFSEEVKEIAERNKNLVRD